jgi:hypothetical protein
MIRQSSTTCSGRLHRFSTALAVVLFVVSCSSTAKLATDNAVEARLDFSASKDGPAPGKFGPGASLLLETPRTDLGGRFRIEGGKLVSRPTVDGRTASYFSTADLGDPITSIGARWVFTPQEGGSGTMVLIVSQRAVFPPFSAQLSVTPTHWTFGVRAADQAENVSQETILKTGSIDPPLSEDGSTSYRTEVRIAGERAELELPDGHTEIVHDKRIAEWAGTFGTFESFADEGLTDSRADFIELWAIAEKNS